MVLAGSMLQQRWQQKSKLSSHPYSKHQKYQNLSKKNNLLNQSSLISPMNSVLSSSSTIEMPEAFGFSSNIVSKNSHFKSSNKLNGTNYHSQNLGASMNQFKQAPYSNMPNYSSGNMSNQFSTGLLNNSQNGLPVVASINQFQYQSNFSGKI